MAPRCPRLGLALLLLGLAVMAQAPGVGAAPEGWDNAVLAGAVLSGAALEQQPALGVGSETAVGEAEQTRGGAQAQISRLQLPEGAAVGAEGAVPALELLMEQPQHQGGELGAQPKQHAMEEGSVRPTTAEDPLLRGVLGDSDSVAAAAAATGQPGQGQQPPPQPVASLPARRRALLEGSDLLEVEDPLDAAVFATPHHNQAEQELLLEKRRAGDRGKGAGQGDAAQAQEGQGEGRAAPQPQATGREDEGTSIVTALEQARERALRARAATHGEQLPLHAPDQGGAVGAGRQLPQGSSGGVHAPQGGTQAQAQQGEVEGAGVGGKQPHAPSGDRRPKDLPAWRQAPTQAPQAQAQQGPKGGGSMPDPLEAAVFQTDLKLPQEGLQEGQQELPEQHRAVPRRRRQQQPRLEEQHTTQQQGQPEEQHTLQQQPRQLQVHREGEGAREASVFETPHHGVAERAIAEEQHLRQQQGQHASHGLHATASRPVAAIHAPGGRQPGQQLFGDDIGVQLGADAHSGGSQQQPQHASRQLGEREGGAEQAGPKADGGAEGQAQHAQRIPVADVLIMTLVMAAAAGLGALPFFFVKSLSMQMTGLATAVACGVMFACSFDLVHSGQPYGAQLVVLGVVLGSIFIRASQQWLERLEDVKFENLQGAGARKTLLLVGVMAAHALGEGCGVGVSFVGDHGWSQGVLTTIAIGIHNVPEGLAKATVLVSQGVGARNALLWSVLTCLPQPLVAIPSFLFVGAFRAILPIALGFAGGCMIWIVFAELLPDAFDAASPKQVATAATLAAAGLEGVRMFFESLDVQGGLSVPNPFPGDLSLLLPALGVMLPAVASAALAGGLLSNAGLPTPVNFGLASALLGAIGALPLLRALLPLGGHVRGHALGWAAAGPGGASGALHAAAGAAAGALLVLLLRHQLLSLLRQGKGGGLGNSGSGLGRSYVDLEAAAKKASDADLPALARTHSQTNGHHHNNLCNGNGYGYDNSTAQLFAAAYPLLHAGPPSSGLGRSPHAYAHANGSSAAAAPIEAAVADFLGSWGLTLHAKEKGGRGLKLAAPQYAACAAAALALAAHTVPQGWHVTGSMLAIAPDLSTLLLPAALTLLPLGAAGGALAAATSQPSPARGAWAGGLLAGSAALWTLLAVARFVPSSGADAGTYDPTFVTARLGAVTGGALCMAAFILFGVGWSVHARRARGGLLLGLLLSLAVYGFAGALCLLSPYCLDVPVDV